MKNLRCLSLAFAFVLVSLPAVSQIRFGAKGGVNIANAKIDQALIEDAFDVENITGFQVGPTMEAMIPILGLGADIGLLYSQRGFKLKNKINEEHGNARIGYIDVPLNLKWKPSIGPIKLYVAAGPYVSVKVSQNMGLKGLLEREELNDFFSIKSKTFSAGLNFGGGIELLKHLQIGFNYSMGLTDDYKNDKINANSFLHPKSSVWSVLAAYYF